jgi:hypothetical protein
MFDLFSDFSGLRSELFDCRSVLLRIAEALERISPTLPDYPLQSVQSSAQPDDSFHMSESGSEYESRLSHEAALAESLGVAPFSPAFQKAISEMHAELQQPRMEMNEEGIPVIRGGHTEEEADQIVRQAFQLARAEANVRPDR